MKILMFGRGVIATIYGWALEQAGHEVEFYVRPGRAATYGEAVDLDLIDARRSLRGRQIERAWPVRYRETLEPDHDFDLIVLSVAHYRLPEAAAFLAPRIGRATVLVLSNLWAEPLEAVAPLPTERLAWGFPQAGGGLSEHGVLRGVLLRSIVLGTLDGRVTPRGREVRETFQQAGFRISEQPDITGWLWIHFAANAGIHAQGLKAGTLSELVGSAGGLREALLTTRELLPLLAARGVDLRRHRRSTLPYRLPAGPTAAAFAWATTHIRAAGRSLGAQTDSTAEEPRAVCRDALATARRLGVATPRLEAEEQRFATATASNPPSARASVAPDQADL